MFQNCRIQRHRFSALCLKVSNCRLALISEEFVEKVSAISFFSFVRWFYIVFRKVLERRWLGFPRDFSGHFPGCILVKKLSWST